MGCNFQNILSLISCGISTECARVCTSDLLIFIYSLHMVSSVCMRFKRIDVFGSWETSFSPCVYSHSGAHDSLVRAWSSVHSSGPPVRWSKEHMEVPNGVVPQKTPDDIPNY